MMQGIYLQVTGSALKSPLTTHLVQGGREQFSCSVELGEEWRGRSCMVCFGVGDTNYQVPIVDGQCLVPDEAISAGKFSLAVVSVEETSTYVTNIVEFTVQKGANAAGIPPDIPTPTLWETYVLQVEGYVDSAAASATTASEKATEAALASGVAVQAKEDGQTILNAVNVAKGQIDTTCQSVQSLAGQVTVQAATVGEAVIQAQTAKTQAVAAQQAIYNMAVQVETLEPDEAATVTKVQNADGSITLQLAVPQGLTGQTGATGQTGGQGPQGNTGVGISAIAQTATDGLADTYTITLTNGNTADFTVTNGQTGPVGPAAVVDYDAIYANTTTQIQSAIYDSWEVAY